jgi:hypothetical protein
VSQGYSGKSAKKLCCNFVNEWFDEKFNTKVLLCMFDSPVELLSPSCILHSRYWLVDLIHFRNWTKYPMKEAIFTHSYNHEANKRHIGENTLILNEQILLHVTPNCMRTKPHAKDYYYYLLFSTPMSCQKPKYFYFKRLKLARYSKVLIL